MIETEQQRRWWFATHPEFSSTREGQRRNPYDDDDEAGRPSPEYVDVWMDKLLKQAKDDFWTDVFRDVKSRYGTEAAPKTAAEKLAFLGEGEYPDSEDEKTEKGSFGSAYGWARDNWEDALRALRDYLTGLGPAVISPIQAKYPSADEIAKRLGTTRDDFHMRIKEQIKKDHPSELKAIGRPKNVDIGVDPKGNIVLRNKETGREINTDVPLKKYGK
ncbi:MAG: hypothetical protein HY913_18915 [Desulfomonile tiedjei]|nr:hypothetical protein [Desulfomonile tiedjei]